MFAVLNRMDGQFTNKYSVLSKTSYSRTNSTALATNKKDIAYAFINLGFKIFDAKENMVDANKDTEPEGYIFRIGDDFTLRKGDILAKAGHVHFYLGDGIAVEAENFGWGRVYRSYPRVYRIKMVKRDGLNYVSLVNSAGEEELYERVYRYLGKERGKAE